MSSTLTATSSHHSQLSPTFSTRGRWKQEAPSLYPLHQFPGKAALCGQKGLARYPEHEMTAAYHRTQAEAYDNRVPTHDPHTLAHIERYRVSTRDAQDGMESYQRYPSQSQIQQYQTQVSSQAQHAVNPASSTVSRQPTRPPTPLSSRSSTRGAGESLVLHSLQIPSCISKKAGNLADFAAQLTCLFWFETPKVLEAAEKIQSVPQDAPLPNLSINAHPTEPFKKWVQTVLSTTQVTQNVILLALLFIYRLKMTNPSVRGRPGSEYRLLTVALMLGNKFLDDNTYTNKTWAEVSGISVQEIHVMEVEFLSNMRYALLASKGQWLDWLDKLGAYFTFSERMRRPASPLLVPSPTLFIPSPTVGRGYSPLSSPTASLQAFHGFATSRSTNGASHYSPPRLRSSQPVNATLYNSAITNSSPLANRMDLGNNRKRSWDEEMVDPPAKRAYRGPPSVAISQPSTSTSNLKPAPDPRRLPVPSLTLNTTPQSAVIQPQHSSSTQSMPQTATLSLPPLGPGTRAMSTVYAPPTTSWGPAPVMANSGSTQSSVPQSTTLTTPTTHYPATSNAGYGTPTRRLSPINTLAPAAAYGTSSPLNEQYHNNGFSTPISHSPSVYLQQRPSPYRPIRHVHTLLNPPPSASLQSYHLPAIPPSQMHYQPIGRRNDHRTGIVPEYRNQAIYNRNSQNNGMTPVPSVPSQQRYPSLVN